jgi:AcrR family transcriptional regulator
MYTSSVPRLWNQTIEAHRREVRDAILDTTAVLVAEHGLLSVTMSQIAEETGIGRATLYKYFPDVEAILHAWHDRQIEAHLRQLAEVQQQTDDPWERLRSVLEAYAVLAQASHGHHDADVSALFHRDSQKERAQKHVHAMIRGLLADAAQTGDIRNDVSPEELATYCLSALGAARGVQSKTAVRRIVTVTMDGLRPML